MLLADSDPGHVEDSNDTNIMLFLRRRTATVAVFYAEILQFFPFIRVIRIYGGWHNNVNTVSFIASARNELKTCGLDKKSIFMHKKTNV